MKKIKNQVLVVLMLAPMLLALGCSRHVSRGLSDQGSVQEVVFPDERKIVHKGGSVPNLDNLRMLGPGINKDQLRGLIGSPHFREGFGAREWDYLFQLPTTGQQATKCRFKVVFDNRMLARNMYWAPAQCQQLVNAAPVAATAPVAAAAPATPLTRHNRRLSQRRAESVRQLLIGAGVPAAAVSARGMGESSTADCSDAEPGAELVACLAPDRRVEIQVTGTT